LRPASRLAPGPLHAPSLYSSAPPPGRGRLREACYCATVDHPDRADLLRETATRLDDELTAHPDQTVGLGNLFFDLCNELGIEVDLATLADDFLVSYSETTCLDEAEINAPDPRATSPP
jgi:hypothetical protein